MILRFSVRDLLRSEQHDVELDAEPDSRVDAVLAALPVPVDRRPCAVDGVPVRPGDRLADSPIVQGCTLLVGDGTPPADPAPPGSGTLHVVTGPAAGDGWRLRPGQYLLGRSQDCDLPVPDPDVSRRHCLLRVSRPGPGEAGRTLVTVEDLGSSNGTVVDDVPVGGPVTLRSGGTIRVGGTALVWEPAGPRPLTAVRAPDGRLEFDRRFAAVPAPQPASYDLPRVTEQSATVSAVLISALVPVLLGAVTAVLFRQPAMLLLSLLSPATVAASWWTDRSQRRRRARRTARERADLLTAISRQLAEETRLRRQAAPDPADLLLAALGQSDRLWSRNADEADGLLLRVGTADDPAAVTLSGDRWPELPEPVLTGVPITVDLRDVGVLGVTGESVAAHQLARWLVLQLATLRSPEDLRLVLLGGADDDLAWARWLPHVEVGPGGGFPAWVGNTPASRAARVAELRDLVLQREEAARGQTRVRFDPEIVLLLDGALAHRELPGMKEVLRTGPRVGVYAIAVDRYPMNECQADCGLLGGGRMRLVASAQARPREVTPDAVPVVVAARAARALAPLRDRLSRGGGQGLLPDRVRLLDLLGIDTPSPEQVAAGWSRPRGPATRVPIGRVLIGADAAGPVTVDLARQGPHTMLGGATGAGKSILLQTLVTSLLLANRQDELNLVLVDFKGGSAFLPFEHCPHVVTLIRSTGQTPADVFDETAAVRVLASVRAEVRHRESTLARYGGELDEYWAARRARPELPPLPRLVLVLDEFARVLDTAPDFLRELVTVAGKGRSLGMHLVLATQSLQGKLTPELKNNIDLRITLRQNEPADSLEVLGVPDAATIPGRLRGRGLILCTKDETRSARPFQCGYLGDPPPDGGPPPVWLRLLDWTALGTDRPAHQEQSGTAATDQDLVVRAVRIAAERLQLPAPRRPVLPPLPATVPLDLVPDLATHPPADTVVPFGLLDDPAGQAQPVAGFDLAGSDRLLVAGGPQSGRTSFIRAFVTAAVHRFDPEHLHLYLVEREPGGLAGYAGLPHCGAVIGPDEPDRLRRLVTLLLDEVERRRARRHSPSGPGPRAPWIVVLVDGWELIENRADPMFVETEVVRRFREVISAGAPLGVHVVAVGGQDLLNGRLPNLYSTRLLLPFPKEDIRRAHLAQGATPPPVLPGRVVDAATGLHGQLALTDLPAEQVVADQAARNRTVAGQAAAGQLAGSRTVVGRRMGERQAGNARARPVLPMPLRVTGRELPAQSPPSDRWFPIGVGGTDLVALGLDLFDGRHLALISGPRGSGRTSCAATVVAGLRSVGVPVLVLAPPRSPLVRAVPSGDDLRVLVGSTVRDADLRAAVADLDAEPYAIVVDDCEQLTLEPTSEAFEELPTLFQDVAQPSAIGRRALVLAGDATPILTGQRRSLARLLPDVLQDGVRILLTPDSAPVAREHGFPLEADQFFGYPPGRGYLSTGRDLTLVQWLAPEPG